MKIEQNSAIVRLRIVIESSSTVAEQSKGARRLIPAFAVFLAAACIIPLLWILNDTRQDPYVQASLDLEGSVEHGGQLFRINCAGCHGLVGQGLVGPKLVGITDLHKDPVLVHQIISGETPPMPSFQSEPQSMADLLAYLHNLS
ncbi:cytochrome c [Synechococcus sp. M16CYN]|uniref:cytochrome c n=1 Tax=Synechococcus sp. M16CYN TaxID=3103139 RepID=UPI0030E497FF